MSHFVTLVNFYMPKLEENCEENMRYAEQIAEVKEKLAGPGEFCFAVSSETTSKQGQHSGTFG